MMYGMMMGPGGVPVAVGPGGVPMGMAPPPHHMMAGPGAGGVAPGGVAPGGVVAPGAGGAGGGVPPAAGRDGPVLNLTMLASLSEDQRRQIIGERLYHQIMQIDPVRAGKITGMLLDGITDVTDLLDLLETPQTLRSHVSEAARLLAEAPQ